MVNVDIYDKKDLEIVLLHIQNSNKPKRKGNIRMEWYRRMSYDEVNKKRR